MNFQHENLLILTQWFSLWFDDFLVVLLCWLENPSKGNNNRRAAMSSISTTCQSGWTPCNFPQTFSTHFRSSPNPKSQQFSIENQNKFSWVIILLIENHWFWKLVVSKLYQDLWLAYPLVKRMCWLGCLFCLNCFRGSPASHYFLEPCGTNKWHDMA